jgi:hypothetical protein
LNLVTRLHDKYLLELKQAMIGSMRFQTVREAADQLQELDLGIQRYQQEEKAIQHRT